MIGPKTPVTTGIIVIQLGDGPGEGGAVDVERAREAELGNERVEDKEVAGPVVGAEES